MKFSLSTNIKTVQYDDFHYIATSNAHRVLANVVADYNSGIHCFTLVGTYGTGKSSFIAALERDLLLNTKHLFENKGQFNNFKKFHAINIIGEYNTLSNVLNEELISDSSEAKEAFSKLEALIKYHKDKNEFLILVIDEFGKILEHAANNNPEKELYFLQQLAEFINHPKHDNILLITTLHQNFGAYSRKLNEQQRNEWEKVKGRFKEIVFSEPVEQLLHLAASQIDLSPKRVASENNFNTLYKLALNANFISNDLNIDIARKLYPLDIIAATILTQSIQRYGQNERSLFSFLSSKDKNSISNFVPNQTLTFNLAHVYDYIVYNFYSYLSEVNTDSTNWRALRVALERVEGYFDIDKIYQASLIVKTIGLCNLFSNSIRFENNNLSLYAKLALDIETPEDLITELENQKIIRYAKYKSQYIIFEGTDVNIEDELYKAAGQVPRSIDFMDELNTYFEFKVVQANASYYKTGTPRFFEYRLTKQAIDNTPTDDIDGFINLIFSKNKDIRTQIINVSRESTNAIVYVYFKNSHKIEEHLYEVKKLEYIRKQILIEDKIADREIQHLITYEKSLLNKEINQNITTFSKNIEWYYKGEEKQISSQADFNKLLSVVCDKVYHKVPIIENELFNKQKPNSAISLARNKLLNTLIDDNSIILHDLGFDNETFPPEKTIYYSLIRNTGLHRKINGAYTLTAPNSDSIKDLWEKCEDFLQSSIEKQQKLSELIKELKAPPFKLKQGFLDFWIPIYLIIKKQDYSLYDNDGRYIPNINREVLELLQKSPNDFRIKAFAIEGVKIEFFNQYRNFINLNDKEFITKDSFLETIKPFLVFYNNLNDYAKNTMNFDSPKTAKFRDVLAKATDPEKTFFEDLPLVFGFTNDSLISNQEFMSQYQDLLKNSVKDLRLVYPNLINQIEENVIDLLGLKSNIYSEYKKDIEQHFKDIKTKLLSNKQKSFHTRLLMTQPNKMIWYESISYVIFDKPLSAIRDNQIPLLIDTIRHLLLTLTKYVDVSKIAKKHTSSDVYRFELISTEGEVKPQSYILHESQKQTTKKLEDQINSILTGDENIDVCTLLRVLKTKIKNG